MRTQAQFSPFSHDHFRHEVPCSQSLLAREVGLFIFKLILSCEVFNVSVVDDDLGIELDALCEPLAGDVAWQVALGSYVGCARWDCNTPLRVNS